MKNSTTYCHSMINANMKITAYTGTAAFCAVPSFPSLLFALKLYVD